MTLASRPTLVNAVPAGPSVRRGWKPAIAWLGCLLVVLGATRFVGEWGNAVVVAAVIMVIAAVGLHVLVHWAGQVSLAQVALVAIGAFVTARANADFGTPLVLAIVLGVAGALVAAILVGLPALRLGGFLLAIATLSFGFAADRWLFLQRWLVPTSTGLPLKDDRLLGFALSDTRQFVVPVVVLGIAVVALTVRIGNTAFGRATRLVAADEEVAASYGVSVEARKLIAFAYAGACAGLAGALTVLTIGRAGPGVFPPTRSILYLSAVLLGGRGPVWGTVSAAAGLGAFPLVAGDLGHYVELVAPLSILLVIRTSDAGLNRLLGLSAAPLFHVLHLVRGRNHLKEET